MYSSRPKVVRIRTRWRGSRRVASIPLTPGISMSMSTTSGWCSFAARTASSPSLASATTSIVPVASSTALKPARIIGWSSAMTILRRLIAIDSRRKGARRAPRTLRPRGARRAAHRAIAIAEQLERAVHLGHRLAAELGDPGGGLDHPGLLDRRPQRLRLDHHEAHVVRHHVVQLARDPPALVRHGLAREEL